MDLYRSDRYVGGGHQYRSTGCQPAAGKLAAGVDDKPRDPGIIPDVTALHSVCPNPFSAATTIRFGLAAGGHVTLRVYDARGMLIRTLENRVIQAGMHQCVWDGRTSDGAPVATGVYFARFSAGSFKATRKVMLLK